MKTVSIASILGFGVSLYVLYREIALQKEVHILKGEEEAWHEGKRYSESDN